MTYEKLFLAFVTLLVMHWVADFVLQTRWMANNKSSNWWALSAHVLAYTGGIAVFAFGTLGLGAWKFLLVNGALHFVTDAVTSRITKLLWMKKMEWEFFCIIGYDQLIHQLCLAITLWWFFVP